ALACTSYAQRIDEAEQNVELWVAARRRGSASVQRLDARAADVPLWVSPNHGLRITGEMRCEQRKASCGRHPSRHAAGLGGKHVRDAASEQLQQCAPVDALHL